MTKVARLISSLLLLSLCTCAHRAAERKPRYDYSTMDKRTASAHKKIIRWLDHCVATKQPVPLASSVRLDSLTIDAAGKTMAIYFNKPFSYPAYRPDHVAAVYAGLRNRLGRRYRDYRITIYSIRQPLEQLVPNLYRSGFQDLDRTRLAKPLSAAPVALVRPQRPLFRPHLGLLGRTIDVRPSHGWYYDSNQHRWQWQRPRLFQTVEDLLSYSFIVPYLLPMLENAGATVFMPRERDVQTMEVIVDNDDPTGYQEQAEPNALWSTAEEKGFAPVEPLLLASVNPFQQGSSRSTPADAVGRRRAIWIPNIPATGEYAVYVAYAASPQHVPDAHYQVHHAGGCSEFLLNQQIGGHTWIYLGRFKFFKGRHVENGSVSMTNQSDHPGLLVSADAVRFGGGFSRYQREGMESRRPRFCEGSKYYLHYLGFPDTLVHDLFGGKDDYRDDYVSRSEYANYLYGAPFGPKKNRQAPGLGIPVDLSLALHTDAGINRSDTTIGTLAIYSVEGSDSSLVFPHGVSRMANRDLADILQTQLQSDLGALYDPHWNRRALMEAQYAEVVRPNMPSALIELLSHQNFLDMTFALDPRFRFDAARALYKGMVKFLAMQHQRPYQIQPLAVTHLQTCFSGHRQVTLRWQPQLDPLEPTAAPDRYIVYTRQNDGGFNHGKLYASTEAVLNSLQPGVIYSYKVTAVNDGGESFPSEILSVCWQEDGRKPLLIVNGFDRLAGPARTAGESFSGFIPLLDQGVAEGYALNYTGAQIDFDPASPFLSNDAPGHGASRADEETHLICGNTFDFAYLHGRSLVAAGRAFVSVSDEAVMAGHVDLNQYAMVDLILGEEKETGWPKAIMDSLRGKRYAAFPADLQQPIARYLANGGNLFVSGAYIGSDLCRGKPAGHADLDFCHNVLRCRWDAGYAASRGRVESVDSLFLPLHTFWQFAQTGSDSLYGAEAPDALSAYGGSRTVLRYEENQFSAAVAYKDQCGVLVCGFPFETIYPAFRRDQFMQAVLRLLAP